MGRPPRKTDGRRLAPPRNRGTRWADQDFTKVFLIRWLPSLIVATAILVVGLPIAAAIMDVRGYKLSTILPKILEYIAAPGGIGIGILGLIGLLIKDRKSPHLASLQIDGDLQTKAMAEQGTDIAEIKATMAQMVSLADKHSAAILEIRAEMSATRTSVSAGATAMQQLQMLMLEEYGSRPPRTRTERSWAVPVAAAPPAPPVRDLPREIPMPPEPEPVEDVRPYVPPAPPRTGSSAAGERKLTPLDPEWTPPPAEAEGEPDERPSWGRSGPPSEALTRFLTGETGTYPAEEIERLAGKTRPFSTEEDRDDDD